MQFRLLIITMFGVLILSSQTLFAQKQHNAWLRGTVAFPITTKLSLDTEFQHRRQSSLSTSNFFGENLMYSYRNWVHYQHNPNLKFSVSPIAYFAHNRIIQSPEDLLFNPSSEVRFSAAIEIQIPLFRHLYIIDRAAVEYRLLSNNHKDITRFRNRLGLNYILNAQIDFLLYNEFILNVSGIPITHFFDQNRINFSIGVSVLKNFRIELGYIHLKRLLQNSSSPLNEHNLFLNITYIIPKR